MKIALAFAAALTLFAAAAWAQSCPNGVKCYIGAGGHQYCSCN